MYKHIFKELAVYGFLELLKHYWWLVIITIVLNLALLAGAVWVVVKVLQMMGVIH